MTAKTKVTRRELINPIVEDGHIPLDRLDRKRIFIALGVGVGNFSSRRKKMEDYVREINQRLSLLKTPTRVIDWFSAAGNFVISTPKRNRWEIAEELSLALGVRCVILTIEQVVSCVSVAETMKSPPPQAGIRWTQGIAFQVKGRPCTLDLKASPRAEFFRINDFAVGVYKKDQLTEENILDREDRAGGWGRVSDDISKAVGGVWTARTLTRVQGIIKNAQKHAT